MKLIPAAEHAFLVSCARDAMEVFGLTHFNLTVYPRYHRRKKGGPRLLATCVPDYAQHSIEIKVYKALGRLPRARRRQTMFHEVFHAKLSLLEDLIAKGAKKEIIDHELEHITDLVADIACDAFL